MTLHTLDTDISKPEKFTYPFCYEPHPLCRLAADEVQRHIRESGLLPEDGGEGKMFGVLVVEYCEAVSHLAWVSSQPIPGCLQAATTGSGSCLRCSMLNNPTDTSSAPRHASPP